LLITVFKYSVNSDVPNGSVAFTLPSNHGFVIQAIWAILGNALRQRWTRWHSRQRRIHNLQVLLKHLGFESHSLRHSSKLPFPDPAAGLSCRSAKVAAAIKSNGCRYSASNFPVLPPRVREYKIQQFPFLAWRLTLEQLRRSLGQLQQLDAFLDVAPIGRLVRLDVAHDPALLGMSSRNSLVIDRPGLPFLESEQPTPSVITTLKLDTFCEVNGLIPNLIKIDVKGAEGMVLRGALQSLRRFRPVLVVSQCIPLVATLSRTPR
jgi:hypothetical protein